MAVPPESMVILLVLAARGAAAVLVLSTLVGGLPLLGNPAFGVHGEDFVGGAEFDGNRWNDLHYTRAVKQAARLRRKGS